MNIPESLFFKQSQLIEKTMRLLPNSREIALRSFSPIQLIDRCLFEGCYSPDDMGGIGTIVCDELVRLAGFEWFDFEISERCSVLGTRHTESGFVAFVYPDVYNRLRESPQPDFGVTDVFFNVLIDLYRTSPGLNQGWHPILDAMVFGLPYEGPNATLADGVRSIDEVGYEAVCEFVRSQGFSAWRGMEDRFPDWRKQWLFQV